MQLTAKTLEKLREIINGDGTPDYRSGPKLVDFFNDFGFHDQYGQGFPPRWFYTEEKLKAINGTPELEECIKKTFDVVEFIDRINQLDALIADFNQYLAFDKWVLIRDNGIITLKKLNRVIVNDHKVVDETSEDAFLRQSFNVDITQLGLKSDVNDIVTVRLEEAQSCVNNDAPLSSVIMIGSILEGVLYGIASSYPQLFNQSQSAPKNEMGTVRKFQEWRLNNFIDVASEIGFLKQDVKKFSHVVRDFRNYIHPYSQIISRFSPDKQTALICLQVLKAAIYQIGEYRKTLQGGTQ